MITSKNDMALEVKKSPLAVHGFLPTSRFIVKNKKRLDNEDFDDVYVLYGGIGTIDPATGPTNSSVQT